MLRFKGLDIRISDGQNSKFQQNSRNPIVSLDQILLLKMITGMNCAMGLHAGFAGTYSRLDPHVHVAESSREPSIGSKKMGCILSELGYIYHKTDN